MTKRAVKRFVREGAFDERQFDGDAKVRHLSSVPGWTPMLRGPAPCAWPGSSSACPVGWPGPVSPSTTGRTTPCPSARRSRSW